MVLGSECAPRGQEGDDHPSTGIFQARTAVAQLCQAPWLREDLILCIPSNLPMGRVVPTNLVIVSGALGVDLRLLWWQNSLRRKSCRRDSIHISNGT
jgi:hypothetical protein